MGLYLSLITGLVIWIIGWAIGIKSFDAFLITILIVLVAASGRILAIFLTSRQSSDDELGETPYR
jgi:hypothetical protein